MPWQLCVCWVDLGHISGLSGLSGWKRDIATHGTVRFMSNNMSDMCPKSLSKMFGDVRKTVRSVRPWLRVPRQSRDSPATVTTARQSGRTDRTDRT